MPSTESYQLLLAAAAACEDKKAEDVRILALDPSESGLTDYFLICNGTNERQNVAITDEIELRLKREFGAYPNSVEGRRQAGVDTDGLCRLHRPRLLQGEARLLRPGAPAQVCHHHQRRRAQRRAEGRHRRDSRQNPKKTAAKTPTKVVPKKIAAKTKPPKKTAAKKSTAVKPG